MILKLKDGEVKIKLFSDIAPNHVKRFKTLADSNQYDGVVFHQDLCQAAHSDSAYPYEMEACAGYDDAGFVGA